MVSLLPRELLENVFSFLTSSTTELVQVLPFVSRHWAHVVKTYSDLFVESDEWKDVSTQLIHQDLQNVHLSGYGSMSWFLGINAWFPNLEVRNSELVTLSLIDDDYDKPLLASHHLFHLTNRFPKLQKLTLLGMSFLDKHPLKFHVLSRLSHLSSLCLTQVNVNQKLQNCDWALFSQLTHLGILMTAENSSQLVHDALQFAPKLESLELYWNGPLEMADNFLTRFTKWSKEIRAKIKHLIIRPVGMPKVQYFLSVDSDIFAFVNCLSSLQSLAFFTISATYPHSHRLNRVIDILTPHFIHALPKSLTNLFLEGQSLHPLLFKDCVFPQLTHLTIRHAYSFTSRDHFTRLASLDVSYLDRTSCPMLKVLDVRACEVLYAKPEDLTQSKWQGKSIEILVDKDLLLSPVMPDDYLSIVSAELHAFIPSINSEGVVVGDAVAGDEDDVEME